MDNFNEEGQNIVQTALAAGQQLAPKVITNPIQDGMPFVVLREADGTEMIHHLIERFEKPARKIAAVKLNDAASFIAYWNKHKQGESGIYGSMTPARFLAVFDDNGKDSPDYRQHRAVYEIGHSKEFKSWSGRDRQPFDSNEKFALWIEDQLPDIVKPEGARMLEIALNFRVNQNAAFSNAVRLQDGNTELTYTADVDAQSKVGSSKVKIPEEMSLSIPVFEGLEAKKYRFDARFRYRLGNGKLTIWYELIRPHKVVEQAFTDLLAYINKESKATVLFGSPE